MAAESVDVGAPRRNASPPNLLRRALREPLAVVGLTYIALLCAVAALAPLVATHDPYTIDVAARLQGPSAEHWLGTDELGRDQFSRIVFGTRIALRAAAQSVGIALLIGVPLGVVIAYAGGLVDRIAMRIIDIIDAIPLLLLAITVVAVLGRSLNSALIGMSIAFAVTFLRLTRGQVLVEREKLYVDTAKVMGFGRLRIMFREILPNASAPLIVHASIYLGIALLVEAMLSFLGIGAPSGEPSWGRMLDDARQWQTQQPWIAILPGFAITLTVLMFNVLGEGLRDAFDLGTTSGKVRRQVADRMAVTSSGHESAVRSGTAPSETTAASPHLLHVSGVSVVVADGDRELRIVRDVSFDIGRGEVFGLVGESGSGKSMTARAIAGLLPAAGWLSSGTIHLDGRDLLGLPSAERRRVRGTEIGMVFQDPTSALSPVHTVGRQLIDPLRTHLGLSKREARDRAVDLLDKVGVADARRRVDEYPYQFSGGMAQRAVIAMALATGPKLLIADEPTTALDVTVQEQVLDLLLDLQDEFGMSILLIAHDLGVIADVCDRVAVMYAGEIVEHREVDGLFAAPQHPYTAALLAATPRGRLSGRKLPTIPGRVPPPWEWPTGCAFAPRCDYAVAACVQGPIPLDRGARCIRQDELDLGAHP